MKLIYGQCFLLRLCPSIAWPQRFSISATRLWTSLSLPSLWRLIAFGDECRRISTSCNTTYQNRELNLEIKNKHNKLSIYLSSTTNSSQHVAFIKFRFDFSSRILSTKKPLSLKLIVSYGLTVDSFTCSCVVRTYFEILASVTDLESTNLVMDLARFICGWKTVSRSSMFSGR